MRGSGWKCDVMEERTLSVSELFTQALTLPVDLQVTKGYDATDKLRSLDTESRIRLHFFRDETIVTARLERGDQQLTIPLYCEELFELLPFTPELDDKRYETVRDLVSAHPMPQRVRVTQGWKGGRDENTIQENDELEDFRSVEDWALGACVVANRVIEVEDRVLKERVCLPYDTASVFTTAANPQKRYRLIDLVHRQLPQRVRVHGHKRSRTGVPASPEKIELIKIETKQIAVCSDLKSGRLFLLPDGLEDVCLSLLLSPHNREGISQYLQMWMNIECLPKIGREAFNDLFRSQTASSQTSSSSSKETQETITILMPCCKEDIAEANDRHAPDYRTFATLGPVQDPESLSRVGTLFVRIGTKESTNSLIRNCKLRGEAIQVQILCSLSDEDYVDMNDYTVMDDGDAGSESDDYDYIFPTTHPPAIEEHYSTVENSSASTTDNQYIYIDQDHKPHESRNPVLPSTPRSQQQSSTSQAQHQAEALVLKNKIIALKNNSEKITKQIRENVEKIDQLTARIQNTYIRENQDAVDPGIVRQRLESLSNVKVMRLLKNLGLGEYVRRFIEAEVEAHELRGCDRAYLEDVGMKSAHAVKLLTVLQGRLPPGVQWERLLQ